jgi:hypothetical protein
MTLQNRAKGLNRMMRTGLILFIVASLVKWSSSYMGARLTDNVVDGGVGLLYGLSIGCMLLGLYRRSTPGNRPCA